MRTHTAIVARLGFTSTNWNLLGIYRESAWNPVDPPDGL